MSSQFTHLIFLQKVRKHQNNVDEYHSQLLIAGLSVRVKVCVCVCVRHRWRHIQSHRVSEEACGRGGAQLAPSNENPLLLKEPGGAPLPSAVRDTAKINLHYPSCTRPQDFPPALCLMTVSSSIFTLSVVGRMMA